MPGMNLALGAQRYAHVLPTSLHTVPFGESAKPKPSVAIDRSCLAAPVR